ncbi:ATP-binding protein [Sphingomonas sp. VNH70]|uniref:ATP-binding protein n=1 Tax=Sphingomonas silueang TaxID=3156617 RepID=UPI0032B52D4C
MNMHVLAPMARGQGLPPERLTPSQRLAFDRAMEATAAHPIVLVESESGMGKSTILRAMHRATGGRFLNAEDILRAHARVDATEYEQVVYDTIRAAIDAHDIVYFDDVGEYQLAAHSYMYHRPNVFGAVFKALYDAVDVAGKTFVVSTLRSPMIAQPSQMVLYRPLTVTLPSLQAVDYRHIVADRLGETAVAAIDFERVHAFSRTLSGHFLTMIGDMIDARGIHAPTTGDVTAILAGQLLKSNVDAREVEAVELGGLVGVEAIVEKLERTILLPLKEPDLARELGLAAKHGVLLYGPPGTGKTTIGRALAHMMKGKFFMIDGDFDHQSCSFFDKVRQVFEAAQRNAPSVIFIDDADVILTDPRLAYFGRYLLTQLDGLMNEASGRICVMMTAMDLKGLPLALLRSGRMEVWLEMKLPDAKARSGIIDRYVDRLPIRPPAFDSTALGAATEGFTPADLRRLVADATGHLALDRHLGDPELPLEIYLDGAAAALRDQKQLADRAFHKRGGRQFH